MFSTSMPTGLAVIPAEAGIQSYGLWSRDTRDWTPAFAGVTQLAAFSRCGSLINRSTTRILEPIPLP
jgi:hypothetical protein